MCDIRHAVPLSGPQKDPQQNSSRGWVENGGTAGVDDYSGRIVLSPIGSRSGTLLHARKLRYDPVSRVSNTLSAESQHAVRVAGEPWALTVSRCGRGAVGSDRLPDRVGDSG